MAFRLLVIIAVGATCAIASTNAGIKCKLLFDGRVPPSAKPADFDKNSSIYDHQFVHGQSMSLVYLEVLVLNFDRSDMG